MIATQHVVSFSLDDLERSFRFYFDVAGEVLDDGLDDCLYAFFVRGYT